jgi:circadian clock protein KaiC
MWGEKNKLYHTQVDPEVESSHTLLETSSWELRLAKRREASVPAERLSTGISGLDDILNGGLPANRLYLLEGEPGTGKTTLALQFMRQGLDAGERLLYVTLSESRSELAAAAASHDWAVDDLTIREYVSGEKELSPDAQVTMFHPSDVELLETIRKMVVDVDTLNPTRVVIDSLSEIQLLAQDSFRFRRQLLALKQLFLDRRCTVLLLDDQTAEARDRHVQSIVHGVLRLEQLAPEYGAERRRLRVSKLRGTSYRGGWHDYLIRRGGLVVFPRLVAAEHRQRLTREARSSGVDALDTLLGGGTQSGTSLLILGPAGAGKTTVALQFVVAAAARGQRAAVFVFDETADLLLERSDGIALPLRQLVEEDKVTVRQVDPSELSPGQFAQALRDAVDTGGARLVVIDSLNGYLAAMPQERQLTAQLHELLTFLAQRDVSTILVFGQQGMIGTHTAAPVDASYLADTIVLLRFFEASGRVRKAISVVKKRSGPHEDTIRELRIGSNGISVGEALTDFRGVLTGTPVFEGKGPATTATVHNKRARRRKTRGRND